MWAEWAWVWSRGWQSLQKSARSELSRSVFFFFSCSLSLVMPGVDRDGVGARAGMHASRGQGCWVGLASSVPLFCAFFLWPFVVFRSFWCHRGWLKWESGGTGSENEAKRRRRGESGERQRIGRYGVHFTCQLESARNVLQHDMAVATASTVVVSLVFSLAVKRKNDRPERSRLPHSSTNGC